ncbi:MAG: response regulator transcription factor [bacterium]|nr:response regulator transcription factor [bacterium]
MVEKAWTTWAVTLLTAYLVLLGLSWMASRLSLFEVAVAVGEVAIIALAIGASVFYLQKSRTTGARQRSIRSFARIHLAVFTVTTLTWVLGMVWTERAANWSAGLAVVLLGSYNLSLLAWSRVCALSTQLPGSELFSHYGITAREREIVDLISAGHTNREIADRLFISPATVKDHNHNVFRKTGVRNRVELANLFRSVDQNDEKAGAD